MLEMINRRGPRIDPWGTPCVIVFVSDLKLCIQHIVFCLIDSFNI